MKKNLFFIGLDISKDGFAASIYETPGKSVIAKAAIPNNPKGFSQLILWLREHHINKTNCRIRMEATGVYSQAILLLFISGFSGQYLTPFKGEAGLSPNRPQDRSSGQPTDC